MINRFIPPALIGLLTLGACGGGDGDERPTTTDPNFRQVPYHHVGHSHQRADPSKFVFTTTEYGLDVYHGTEERADGVWGHWSVDLGAEAEASFGIAVSPNWIISSWAYGRQPDTGLAANSALRGTASWTGGFVGYGLGPGNETIVAAKTDLSVNLDTLAGRIAFMRMEYWPRDAGGHIGTGTRWGDGGLNYSIAVSGNFFADTGGDHGDVIGAFFGAEHGGMGGTLERSDLYGAFGGIR